MNILQAIILGCVEGFTEFLPISSTGHLIIAQKLMGMSEINTFFTDVIQSGAILAAVFYYRDKLTKIFVDSVVLARGGFKMNTATHDQKLGLWMILGIIPTLAIAFVFRKQVDQWQNNLLIVAVSTIFFGIVFYFVELWQKKQKVIKDIKTVSLTNLLVMGVAQGIAIVPGVSRSGITVTGGLSQKLSMKESIDIAFIMGIPVLFIATLYKLVTEIKHADSNILFMTLVGTVVSFGAGLYSIKLTLGFLQKYGFKSFMIYRIALGVILLGLYMNGLR
jgi:undecaprenyl-diphosphatase